MKISKIIRFLLYLVIPFSIAGPIILNFDMGSFSLFPSRILSIVLFLTLIMILPMQRFRIFYHKLYVKNYLYFIFFGFFYATISILWCKFPILGIKNLFLFLNVLFIFFLTILYLDSEEKQKVLLTGIVILLVATFIFSTREYYFGIYTQPSIFNATKLPVVKLNPAEMHVKSRVTGGFYNPNGYGTFLALFLPVIFSYFVRRKNLKKVCRTIFTGVCVVGICWLFLTTSRANIFAFFIMVLLYFTLIFKLKGKVQFAIFALIVGIFFWHQISWLLPNSLFRAGRSIIDEATIVRWSIFRNNLIAFVHSYGLGVGPGILQLYGDPHNWYTEILFQFGPLVFVGYIIFYLSLLVELFKVQQKSLNGLKYLAEGLFISLAGYSIGCLSDSSRLLAYDSWAIFAMSICVINIYRRQKYSNISTTNL